MSGELLFVYGSLMRASGHPMQQRLAEHSSFIGRAWMAGELYRLSWYPGAVATDDLACRVHGDLVLLHDPAKTLEWLDDYEGVGPGFAHPQEYVRVECPVYSADGREMPAWVYLYNQSTEGKQRVESGDFSAYL